MKQQLIQIFISIAAGIVTYFISQIYFTPLESVLLGIVMTLVFLWTNEALPVGVVSLLPIILFPAFGILDINKTSENYANSIIFLFIGGFILSIAFEKTGLHKIIIHWILSLFPNTVTGIVFSLSITSGLLSSCLSNTTTSLLLMPIALYLSEDKSLKLRFALAIAYGASIGGIITPIGTPPNLILMGFMETKGITPIPFMHWIFMVLPLAGAMLLFNGILLSWGTRDKIVTHDNNLPPINRDQKKLLYILGSIILLLVINSPVKPYYNGLGLDERGILLAYGLLMFIPPVNLLKWDDTRNIPYEIIFLFGAGFSISTAFTSTGLAQVIADMMMKLNYLTPLVLFITVAFISVAGTTFMSNTALISILIPILFAMGEANAMDSRLLLMIATIAVSYAFMLPISTPPNAIAVSSGVVPIGSMAKYGFIMNIAGIVLIVFIASFVWKFML